MWVKTRAEGDAGAAFDFELVDDTLGSICRAEDLDFGSNESHGMRLGGGVLQVPALLRFLSESENFLARGDGEHAQVFVLGAIL